jgi:hypothetical protein
LEGSTDLVNLKIENLNLEEGTIYISITKSNQENIRA